MLRGSRTPAPRVVRGWDKVQAGAGEQGPRARNTARSAPPPCLRKPGAAFPPRSHPSAPRGQGPGKVPQVPGRPERPSPRR